MNNTFRKVITFVFTLIFVVSTVMGTLPAFSLNTDKTDLVEVTYGFHHATPGKIGETVNVLKGVKPYINEYVAPAGTVDAADISKSDAGGNPAYLTDGDYSTNYGSTSNPFHNGTEGIVDGRVYNKIAFDLGKTTEITDILVAHYKASSGFGTGKFKLYVSDTKGSLFNSENLVADVTNTEKAEQNVISTNSGKTLSGQFVGIIVTNPVGNCASTKYNYCTRINEFAVFAKDTSVLPTPRATVESSDTNDLPELDTANGELNITSGKLGEYYSNLMGDGVDKLLTNVQDYKYKVLTDGDTSIDDQPSETNPQGGFLGYDFRYGEKDPNELFNGRVTAALTYDLGAKFELTKFTLVSHAKNAYAPGQYRVYASNTKSALFSNDNFVIEIKNPNGDQKQVVTFKKDIKARYVGVRFIQPCTDYSSMESSPRSAYLRLREIAVYGKATEADRFTQVADSSLETDKSLGEENILAGLKAEEIKYYTPTTNETIDDTGKFTDGEIVSGSGQWAKRLFKFYDGDKVIGNGISLGDYHVDITFNLGGTAKIKGFEVFNSTSFNGGLATHKYQIYASNSAADLFSAANLLVDYTNDGKARNSFALTSGKAIEAQYYGVRVLDPTSSKDIAIIKDIANIYPRIKELTLYGEKPVQKVDAVLTDEIAKLPTNYEGTNLAPQSEFVSKFMDLKGEYVTAVPYTTNSDLIDSNVDSEYRTPKAKFADINDPQKWLGNGIEEGSIYQDLIFDLKYIANITGLTVINNKDNKYATYKYEIYFANTKADLFKGEAFYKMVNEGGNQRNSFDISLLNQNAPKEARFVGIRVIDPTYGKFTSNPTLASNAYLRLQEIAIFGTLTQEGGDPYVPVITDNNAAIPDNFSGDNIALQAKSDSMFLYPATGKYEKLAADSSAGFENLTDGDVKSELRTSGGKFGIYDKENPDKNQWIGNGFAEGDIYHDITIDLNYIANINALSLIFNKTDGLATHKYELYFGNVKEELFSGSPFYTMTNSDAALRNIFDLAYLNGGQPVSARFVGIRVLDPTTKKPTEIEMKNCYTRIMEASIFGNLTTEGADPKPDYSVLNDDVIALPDWGTNIALGKQPKTYHKNASAYLATSAKGNAYLSDGDVKTQFEEQSKFVELEADGTLKANHTYYGFGDWYTDIIYDFLTEVSVDGFALIHHSTTDMIARRYQIYVADKKSKIFDSENLVCEISNEEPFRRNAINFKEKDMTRKGRYFAIRVLAPTKNPEDATSLYGTKRNSENQLTTFNHVSTRFFELGIYGSYTDPNFVYKPKFTPMIKAPEDSYFNGNLLLHKKPKEIYFNSQRAIAHRADDEVGAITNGLTVTPYGEKKNSNGTISQLTHCDFSKFKFAVLDGTQYVDFYWDLSKNYNITKFAMLSMVHDQTPYFTGWYRLYVSEDLDLLFDEESIAFEYNALAEEPDEICRGQEKVFENLVVGRYVAVRILSPVNTAATMWRPRITEVGIWGEEAVPDMSPVNLTKDMPVLTYLGDIGKLKEIDELTLNEIKNLSDGNNRTGATIKTGGKKLQIIYNLCQDVSVYSFLINSWKGKTNLKNYKVYAANSQAEVWSKEALVYTHKDTSATGQKKFAISKNMRYLRLEITDEADEIFIGDVQIIGPKAELLRNKNLNKNLSENAYIYFLQDCKTGAKEYFMAENINMDSKLIHDGSSSLATSIRGGKSGKKSINIIIDLGDNRNVNSLKVDFPRRVYDYHPTRTHIYFGNDVNEIESLDAKPIRTFDKAPTNNSYNISFAPKTGRFVRICFEKAPKNQVLDEMIIALNEIIVMGTGVEGMNGDSKNIMDFEDKELGVKWGIVKSTTNDVINDVATSKIVVSKSTNWQKRSLERSPYLRVVGGKNYTFKFYDIVGNEIKDLEGREIEVSFKLRDGMTQGTAMLGYAGNKWYIQPYETTGVQHKGYATAYFKSSDVDSITVSMLDMVSSNDEYWSTIGELEDYGDEKPQYAPNVDTDKTMSYNPIITEDTDFSVEPIGTLKLPTDSVLYVDYTTYTLTQEVYDGVLPFADPNYVAATYSIRLIQEDVDYLFDGKVKVMLTIPEVLKGYFTGYKLVYIDDLGMSELVDYTREDDKIYFETRSLNKFVLVGEGYSADGNAVLEDDNSVTNPDSLDEDIQGSESPNTGESSPTIYFIVSMISLAIIVILNSKNLFRI